MSFLNLRISGRVIVVGVAALFVFSCSDADSQADSGNGEPAQSTDVTGGAGRQTPEPGSAPAERIDTRNTVEGERSPSREPLLVGSERLLVLPYGALPEPVAPRDIEMGEELAGEFLTGAESELYRIVDRFLTLYSEGEIAVEYVSAEYTSSVRRRLEPATDSGALPDAWRIGRPQFSSRGAAVPVRLFALNGLRPDSAMGRIYLDESGLVEDVQIDVRALGVE